MVTIQINRLTHKNVQTINKALNKRLGRSKKYIGKRVDDHDQNFNCMLLNEDNDLFDNCTPLEAMPVEFTPEGLAELQIWCYEPATRDCERGELIDTPRVFLYKSQSAFLVSVDQRIERSLIFKAETLAQVKK